MDDLPALLGGTPLRPQGPPDWPLPDDDVRIAVEAALRDGSWGKYHGPHLPALEQALATFHDVPHVLTCASGTLAGETALRSVPVGPGDEVLLAAYDYEANFLNVHAVGATPVLADIDPNNCNLSPANLEAALSPATKAILISHLHGGLVPMRAVRTVADRHRLILIEDAAQATGATVEGKKAGSWGDVGILSFGGSKMLTAGRGGALLIQKPELRQRAKVWLSRGVGNWGILSELQAAALLPQLAKLPERTVHRAQQVKRLAELLHDVPGLKLFLNTLPESVPAYYKVGFLFDEAAFGLSRELFVKALRSEGIAFDEGFRALHFGRAPNRFRAAGPLPNAEAAHRQVVMLHHPVLSLVPAEVELVAQAVRKTYRNAHRWGAP